MFDANEYKQDLLQRFKYLGKAYATASEGLTAIRKQVYIKDCLPSPLTLINDLLSSWVSEKADAISAAFNDGTGAKIPFGLLPTKYTALHGVREKLVHPVVNGSMSIEDAGAALVSVYDAEGLAAFMKRHAEGLSDAGYTAAANALANALNLNATYRRAAAPMMRASRYAFEVSISPSGFSGNYYSTDIEILNGLAQCISIVERDMGVIGGSPALQEIHKAFMDSPRGFESRTALNKGQPISATVFNSKVVLSFSPILADAMLAFISIHASVPIAGAPVQKSA